MSNQENDSGYEPIGPGVEYCPVCDKKCDDLAALEQHVLKSHNIAPEVVIDYE